MIRFRLTILCLPVALFAAPSADDLQFFETRVRPVLAEHCYDCHSVGAKKVKGDLLLDHISFHEKGGDTGPATVAGKLDESLLIEAVRYKNIDLQMPPREKLSDTEIADLEEWVRRGAPWPDEPIPTANNLETFDWKARRDSHWSWQPIQSVEPPAVNANDWPRLPMDRFVLSQLEKAGLTPSPETDRRTWLRRVSFDLTGLPPSLEEIDAFVADTSDAAYEAVVDRLLASSAYGERWGRHWLDLMRYAESCGHEFDYTLEDAHQYRDYVIRAFNTNVPYNDLVREHVAGDLMESPRIDPQSGWNESLIGTGFWFLHEAVHAPTDVKKDEADRIDNQIDVFSKSFLGLTVACSRCHDHKFDAIPTKDYYALSGYLQSARMQRGMLDPGGKIAAAAKQLKPLRAAAKPDSDALIPWLMATQAVRDYQPEPVAVDLLEPVTNAPIVFDDFEGDMSKWTLEGDALTQQPAQGSIGNQQPVSGFLGKGLVNTFVKGDGPQGSATSQAFPIERRFINFYIGGGHHVEKTVLELLVDGAVVRSEVGRGPIDNELLTPRSWKVDDLIGKQAQLRIADRSGGGWGHILIDHIVFSDTADERTLAVVAIAEAESLDKAKLKEFCETVDKSAAAISHPLHAWHLLAKSDELTADFEKLKAKVKEGERPSIPAESLLSDFEQGFGRWHTTGEAFGERPIDGVASSRHLSTRFQGVLRSPTFTLEEKVFFLIRAEKAQVRLIIDGYQMEVRNGLLFGGTSLKDLSTKGEWKWMSLGNSMYNGHRAHLEFHDTNDGYVEIQTVSIANPPPPPYDPATRTLVQGAAPANLEALAQRLADALDRGALTDLLGPAKTDPAIAAIEKSIPNPVTCVAMAEGSGEDEFVFIRGSHKNLGELAPRQLLVAIAGEDQPTAGDGSGRMELVDRMFAPENPFPARVMVNRLWHHLFARGIVPTVNDFGEMGLPPSHPQLLDFLAEDFRSDWDIKRMLRMMVLSQTYRQDSKPANPKAELADPENNLLHRMPIRRLQAEAIRDSVLAISGTLNPTMYGRPVGVHLTEFQQGRGRPGSGPLDGAGRRSVYLSVRRNFMSSFMLTYDFPTPYSSTGRRTVSNVPAQALVMMNDPFVVAEAKRWAERLGSTPIEARLETAYQQAFARPPTDAERQRATQFLEAEAGAKKLTADHPTVWSALCHALMNVKEFIYLN